MSVLLHGDVSFVTASAGVARSEFEELKITSSSNVARRFAWRPGSRDQRANPVQALRVGPQAAELQPSQSPVSWADRHDSSFRLVHNGESRRVALTGAAGRYAAASAASLQCKIDFGNGSFSTDLRTEPAEQFQQHPES